MKTILCAHLSSWPIDRRRRAQAATHPPSQEHPDTKGKNGPLLIVRTVADRQLIVAASREAMDLGIRPAMTLTQARALYAGVTHAEHEPLRDRRALEALGRWLMRFTPDVALDSSTGAEGIFLNVSGCERLFGGLHPLLEQVAAALANLRISARLAIAPTPGAAWALAMAGPDRAIVAAENLEAALATLPPRALRITGELSAALHHLGLTTIGQVIHLPRGLLPARFGPELLLRVDQALGRIAEPLVPLRHLTPIAARMDFDGVISSLETIWAVFQNLIGQIIPQLIRVGCGARRLQVELLRPYGPPVRQSILLSRPSRDPVNLFNLFRCGMEGMQGMEDREQNRGRTKSVARASHLKETTRSGSPSYLQNDGFSGMVLRVALLERLTDEQIGLLGHEEYAGQIELDRLIERLRIRLGESSILQTQLIESHIPERAWEADAAHASSRRKKPAAASPGGAAPLRPLHLLPKPIEVRVMVSPSDDAEGRPIAFTHGREFHEAAHAVGPERIDGRWWDGHDKTRDYFDVADPMGRRFWLFRVRQTNRWYWQGNF